MGAGSTYAKAASEMEFSTPDFSTNDVSSASGIWEILNDEYGDIADCVWEKISLWRLGIAIIGATASYGATLVAYMAPILESCGVANGDLFGDAIARAYRADDALDNKERLDMIFAKRKSTGNPLWGWGTMPGELFDHDKRKSYRWFSHFEKVVKWTRLAGAGAPDLLDAELAADPAIKDTVRSIRALQKLHGEWVEVFRTPKGWIAVGVYIGGGNGPQGIGFGPYAATLYADHMWEDGKTRPLASNLQDLWMWPPHRAPHKMWLAHEMAPSRADAVARGKADNNKRNPFVHQQPDLRVANAEYAKDFSARLQDTSGMDEATKKYIYDKIQADATMEPAEKRRLLELYRPAQQLQPVRPTVRPAQLRRPLPTSGVDSAAALATNSILVVAVVMLVLIVVVVALGRS